MTVAAALERNPLDAWAVRRTGIAPEFLKRKTIVEYQLRAIQQTVAWVRSKSSFYAEQLAGFPTTWPQSLDEFMQAPLTAPSEIIGRGHEFLCVPQNQISRVVTLESSGTCGGRKRVFFTAEDQNLALDFFAHGVAAMAEKGDRMLIALPGEREGSVGFQLARGISCAGVVPIPHGLVVDPLATVDRMDREKPALLIGLPVQMLAVAIKGGEVGRRVFDHLHTIVLCSDHVPQSLVLRIRQATGCEVFEHYGSTEMGLGGGVDCRVHAGYHLREADLFFEIVSPETGEPVTDGQMGEVVFTTLGRLGMPLIRYRTGDVTRIIPGPCPCGSPLRRMERVRARVDSHVVFGPEGGTTIGVLDESLFAISGVQDFAATLVSGTPSELQVTIYAPGARKHVEPEVESALMAIPAVGANCASGALRLRVDFQDQPFPVTGAKRKIRVQPLR
ncbi:MAG TPA: AMP-binding protein [Terracidiphilus sp.]|nr:AMP-binding protein [Terracidiphilus sp.]